MEDQRLHNLQGEYKKALDEWINAANKAHSYISITPIDIEKDIPPKTIEETENMIKAYEDEEKLRKIYIEKQNAFINYMRTLKK